MFICNNVECKSLIIWRKEIVFPIDLDTLRADKVGLPIVCLGAGYDGLVKVHRGKALEN